MVELQTTYSKLF